MQCKWCKQVTERQTVQSSFWCCNFFLLIIWTIAISWWGMELLSHQHQCDFRVLSSPEAAESLFLKLCIHTLRPVLEKSVLFLHNNGEMWEIWSHQTFQFTGNERFSKMGALQKCKVFILCLCLRLISVFIFGSRIIFAASDYLSHLINVLLDLPKLCLRQSCKTPEKGLYFLPLQS